MRSFAGSEPPVRESDVSRPPAMEREPERVKEPDSDTTARATRVAGSGGNGAATGAGHGPGAGNDPWTGAGPRLIPLLSALSIQPRLDVGSTSHPREREADLVADRVLRSPVPPRPAATLPLPTPPPNPHVRSLLGGPQRAGTPLTHASRRFFEPRFGHDLAAVRIHADAQAARAARRIGARAFTAGRDIYFGAGHYSPATPEGRRLLAHELTHVLQQGSAIRRQPEDGDERTSEAPETGATGVVAIRRAVAIDRVMSAEEFLVEVIRQYKGLPLEQAREEATRWSWVNPPRPITEEDVRRGFRLVNIRDRTQTLQPSTEEERSERAGAFWRLPQRQRDRLNAEANDRFWEATNYRPGEQLGDSPADRAMADTWLRYRDQVTREHLELAALPEGIRAAMFDQYATRTPDPSDYPQLLRIARRLQELTPAQLEDYRQRINAVTDDLDRVEESVERYMGMLARREEEAASYRQIETRLYNMEDLYHLLKNVRATQRLARLPSSDEYGVQDPIVTEARLELPDLQQRLSEALRQNGFDSVAEFEAALETYVDRFAQQARNIANDMLARGDHELFEQQRRYQQTDAAEQLHQRIQASQATEEHERGWAAARRASSIGAGADESNWEEVLEEQKPHLRESREAFEASRAEFESAVGSDVLAGRLEGHQRLRLITATDAGTVRATMLDYIAEKREAIAETRANLADDPDLVFELDEVLAAAYQELEVAPGSIYDLVIRDHISDVSIAEAILSIAKGVFALILAIGGGIVGGPVGAGAALLAFGIGAEEAVSQFREWEVKSAAHDAGLLADDPSFGWVILAVVGAGLDLAGAVAAVRAMRPAVEAFNATGDLARLERALSELSSVNARVQANVVRAARAEQQFKQAVRGLLATSGRLNAAVIPGAEEFARLVQIAYYAARRGVVRFERYLLELKAEGLIDDIDALTGAPLQRYKEAFEEGVSEFRAEARPPQRRIVRPAEPAPAQPGTGSQPPARRPTPAERPSPLRSPGEGPRPGETGLQYERRVFRETPLAPASAAYRGWRGGSRGSFQTWWSRLPQRLRRTFAPDLAQADARAERIMAMSTDEFVAQSSNARLRALWARRQQIRDDALEALQELRRRQADLPASSAEYRHLDARIQSLTEQVDEINTFELGQIGNRRPDQIELFPEEGRAVVTDITLAIGDRWHNFKTMLYQEVVRDLTRWDDVFGIEFRTAREQLLFD